MKMLASLMVASIASVASAQAYRLIDLGTLHGESEAFGIGSGGEAVGTSAGASANFSATRFSPQLEALPALAGRTQQVAFGVRDGGSVFGTAYTLGAFDAASFEITGGTLTPIGNFVARDANASGQYAGTAWVESNGFQLPRAVRAGVGGVVVLPTLGGLSSQGLGIDALGRVVGSSTTTAENGPRPCVWIGTSVITLPTLGGTQGVAQAIRGGTIVGWSQQGSGLRHATRWTVNAAGAVLSTTDLGALVSGEASYALGINGAGDVVGTSGYKAVLWQGGAAIDLTTRSAPAAGWRLEKAWAINAAGSIVGRGTFLGAPRAFRLDPRCPADLDDGSLSNTPDGGVDINDLVFFLDAFEAGSLAADLDNDGDPSAGVPDGGVDVNDLVYFLARFELGC